MKKFHPRFVRHENNQKHFSKTKLMGEEEEEKNLRLYEKNCVEKR